jgi:hypothetical protein
MRTVVLVVLLLLPEERERVLYDFEDAADLASWSNLSIENPAEADQRIRKEPPVKVELSAEHVSSGKSSLKLTFEGGAWPTVTRALPNEDWMPFHRLTADVTVTRDCLVGFTVLQEESSRKEGWDPVVGRWTRTQFCRPGRNVVTEVLHRNDWQAINAKLGPAVRFEIFMYNPRPGESIWVDHVRLSRVKDKEEPPKREFKVLGTDMVVSGVQELGKKLAAQWKKPEPRTVDEVEGEFRARFEKLKTEHPKARLAVFRDGEDGYAGWRDAYFNSHGPDGMTFERSRNFGTSASQEIFMRHRSPVMKVDLSSIPKGSKILAARLIVVRSDKEFPKDHNPEAKPTMWAVEPCARPWVESEVNAYEWAKDKFWRAIGGQYYGEDPDFWPVYLAYGQSQGKVCFWDFAEAVRFWTDGARENHGFMLHGDSHDWMGRACYREWPEVKNRPAVLVAWVPPTSP